MQEYNVRQIINLNKVHGKIVQRIWVDMFSQHVVIGFTDGQFLSLETEVYYLGDGGPDAKIHWDVPVNSFSDAAKLFMTQDEVHELRLRQNQRRKQEEIERLEKDIAGLQRRLGTVRAEDATDIHRFD